jgi:uncharacterized C2H2 Zn-finger protein
MVIRRVKEKRFYCKLLWQHWESWSQNNEHVSKSHCWLVGRKTTKNDERKKQAVTAFFLLNIKII